jgi:CPA2 family monovalent cation:H+ antiporter-2
MAYLATVQEQIEMQEQILKNDLFTNFDAADHAWDSEFLKKELKNNEL